MLQLYYILNKIPPLQIRNSPMMGNPPWLRTHDLVSVAGPDPSDVRNNACHMHMTLITSLTVENYQHNTTPLVCGKRV